MRIIRKHSNRKMYDPVIKTWSTLSNIRDLVKRDEPFAVLSMDNQDITRSVLVSALNTNNTLSEETLRQLIKGA